MKIHAGAAMIGKMLAALIEDVDRSTKRHLTALLTSAGHRVGSAGVTQLSSGGRRWPAPEGTPHDRAYVLFRIPVVDVALFETDGDELLQHGFASDRCDLAVVMSPVPTVRNEERDPAEFVNALTNALSPEGNFVVTNAWTSARLGVAPSRVILVAGPEDDDSRNSHLGSGGRAVFVHGRVVVLGNGTQPAFALGPVPGTS